MSRLPTPGGDDGTWGNILNDFLNQEHNADGTQKTLPLTKGGTGATNATTARTNLAAVGKGDLVINVKDYGATGDGVTDDTAAIQAAINAVVASGGGIVFFSSGTYIVSTLRYSTGVILRGVGMFAVTLSQKVGTADFMVKSANNGQMQQGVIIDDIGFNAFNNLGSSLGGIQFEGTTYSKIQRCRFNQIAGAAIRILGGATQGDSMYDAVTGCLIQNLATATVGIQLSPSTQVLGGSHPDGFIALENTFSSILGTAIKLDPPSIDAVGALGCDNCQFISNRTVEVPIAFDIIGQNIHIAFNRCEKTSGTMTTIVQAGTTNFPTTDVIFMGNGWPTHGDPNSFIFTDNGKRTVRIADNDSGGTNYLVNLFAGAYADRIRMSGDTNDRFAVRADGQIEWGPGNAVTDTKLTRGGAGLLRLFAEYNSLLGSTSAAMFSGNIGGEGGRRWKILGSGELDIGPGDGTYDIHLLRDAAAGKRLNLTEQFAAGDGVTTKYLSGAGKTTVVDGDFGVTPGIVTNATAPASDFTLGLYPVTGSAGGGAAATSVTVGSVVTGSTVAFTAPGASVALSSITADFACPVAGLYALCVVISANMAVNSSAMVRGQLAARAI